VTAVSRKLGYFLGSGHLGLTYLCSLNGYLFESPVAYYAASRGLDMKPGLESMTQAAPASPVQAECLRCHMSAVQHSDSGTVNRYRGLPFLHGGITCESCHGDTRQHLVTGGHAVMMNPSKLNASLRDAICISCHLEGDISIEREGYSALDFKPGDSRWKRFHSWSLFCIIRESFFHEAVACSPHFFAITVPLLRKGFLRSRSSAFS
jgi:hypothetical protein